MARVNLATIKNWFRTGLKPTQSQFWDTWDSFWHKDEFIPAERIENLTQILLAKADADALTIHKIDANAHSDLFLKKLNSSEVSAVGLSGLYNDLIDKPNIKSVKNEYATIALLLADQLYQSQNAIQFVNDASGDSTVDAGYAYYEYLGTVLGTMADYRKLSEQESMDFSALEKIINKQNSLANDGTGVKYPTVDAVNAGLSTSVIKIGFEWKIRVSASNNQWYSVTYGNGLFVAVSYSGVGNRVMTSPDGINWTSRVSAADNNWDSIIYGNGLFVAVAVSGIGNRVMTSPDGINWTIRTSAADYQWRSVTYGNGLFVAVADTDWPNNVMTSPDGINWTIRVTGLSNSWIEVTYGNGLFVAVSFSGGINNTMTSPDGINWTGRPTLTTNSLRSITYGNGIFVIVMYNGGSIRVMTSPNGINWTNSPNYVYSTWFSVTYGDGLFVAVAYNASTVNVSVMISPDGINWTPVANTISSQWESVTYGNGIFVAVSSSDIGNRVMTSGGIIDYEHFSNKKTDIEANKTSNVFYAPIKSIVEWTKTTTIENVTLLAANWALVAGFYEYNYANALILANSIIEIIPYNSAIETIKQAEILPMVISAVGTLKIQAKYLPTANILIAINITK